jgi:cytochrome c oxidase subunit 1
MRTVLATLAVLAALATAVVAAVVGLGLYDVSARSGHWAVTRWVLHTTYRNAVRLRAPSSDEVPDLSDPALVELGARHFDSACRFCHAAPGDERTATALSMEPAPPHVADAVAGWEPRHIAWIVREGVKMSGMPAWPADRPDEVWPVVAFLDAARRMDPANYARLTAPPDAGYCAGCHGEDGVGELGPHVPRLDIQSAAYLTSALESYREGRRQAASCAMRPLRLRS